MTIRRHSKIKSTAYFLGLLCLNLAVLQPALASKEDREKAMAFSSVKLDGYNAPNTITTLTGKVVATQGSMKLAGDVAKLYLDEDSQAGRVVVTGNPAHIEQMDDKNNLMQGDAATIDYDNVSGIAVLAGNASMRQQERGEFSGDKLTYNTATALITGDSAGDGLVHGVILPKSKRSPTPGK